MTPSIGLLTKRRFLPLFVTQFLGAFNDNLFKTAMVLFVTYRVFSDPAREQQFSGIATALFIIPFVLLSALSGQLADGRDKSKIIRLVKLAEIFIMIVGSAGLMLAAYAPTPAILIMLAATLAMGIHSTFFGPIKYAILPQHLHEDEVLGGTGLVEASTYLAILAGTILAGFISIEMTAGIVIAMAVLGYFTGRQVPPAPAIGTPIPIDYHIGRSAFRLVSHTLHIPRLFLAICAISFFWLVGTVLIVEFPPLVKNVFTADKTVASLFLSIFSIGVAIGSVLINRLLGGVVSAKYGPISVIGMGAFVVFMWFVAGQWQGLPNGQLYTWREFIVHPGATSIFVALLGIAICGGMFVVPLYAFLTTTVPKDQTARTVAANNIVNSCAMVLGSIAITGVTMIGVTVLDALLIVAAMCLIAAFLAWKLHKACD